jgi:hypothetical protein
MPLTCAVKSISAMAYRTKQKIYCFNNGGTWHKYLLVAALCEDGYLLASQPCSYVGFMQRDIGITSDRKHEFYNRHCGAGNWELVWVEDPEASPEIALAISKNQQIFGLTEKRNRTLLHGIRYPGLQRRGYKTQSGHNGLELD